MRKVVFLTLLGALGASAYSFNLVTNGDFELGTVAWTESSSGGYALIGDWSGTTVSSAGDLGPATKTAWLGGYDFATDSVTQTVNTMGASVLILSFDFYIVNEDVAGYDYLTVYFGGTPLGYADLGDNNPVGLYGPYHVSLDISSFISGGNQDLKFEVTTDSSFGSAAFIDNVSLEADVVPEPATIGALALGLAAIAGRRRRK